MRTRSTAIYSAAILGGQLLGLLKTLLIARIVGIENQGLIVAVGVAAGLAESFLTLGNAWQVVQAEDGNKREFLCTLQLFNVARGVVVGLLIAGCGPILESASGLNGLRGPMIVIGLCSAVKGMMNLGIYLAVREHRTSSLALVEFVPGAVALAAVLPIASVTEGVWIFAWVQLVSATSYVVISHLASDAAFGVQFSRRHLGTIFRFALPLCGAGLVYWLNVQGDRLVLMTTTEDSSETLAALLGLYGTTLGLVVLACTAITKVLQTLVMPVLSRHEPRSNLFDSQAAVLVRYTAMIAIGLAVGVSASLPGLVTAVLGPEYAASATFLPLVGVAAGIQYLRRFHYLVGMSTGCTALMLVGNLARLSGLVVAAFLYIRGWGLQGLAWGAIVGELVSYLAVAWYPSTRGIVPARGRFLFPCLVFCVTLPWLWATQSIGLIASAFIATPLGALAGIFGLLWMSRMKIHVSAARLA